MKSLETVPSPHVLWAILAISFIGMLVIWVQFLELEEIMQREGGYGIVHYELAFTPQKVAQILSTWGAQARAVALRSLLIDYAFMLSYGLFFAAVTLLIVRAQTGAMREIGLVLTIGSVAAALLDALENAMLLIILNSAAVPLIPPLIAGIAASIKFLLLILSILYWGGSLIVWNVARFRQSV